MPESETISSSANVSGRASGQSQERSAQNRIHTENLERELERLREDVANLASSIKHIAGNAATAAMETFKERFEAASGDVQSAMANSKATAQRTVEEHPLTTIIIALGLGFLIGQWMRR